MTFKMSLPCESLITMVASKRFLTSLSSKLPVRFYFSVKLNVTSHWLHSNIASLVCILICLPRDDLVKKIFGTAAAMVCFNPCLQGMLSNGILSGIKFIYLYSVAAHLILNELEDASHMRNKKNLAYLTLIGILNPTLLRLLTAYVDI